MSQWQIGVIITLMSLTVSFVFSVLSYKRNTKNDTQSQSETKGVLQSDVGYIKAGIDDLKRENRAVNLRLDNISERVTRVEESAKQAHKRINEVRGETHENN